MKTSNEGIDLIKRFEGYSSTPYKCQAGKPTIGYGSTRYLSGRAVSLGDMPINRDHAHELLKNDIVWAEKKVNDSIKIELKQNEFDALVSHTYNTGGSDTLFQMINSGDIEYSEWWLNTYITAKGHTSNGLKNRRGEELEYFLK